MKRNIHFDRLPDNYLFAKIQKRIDQFKQEHPDVQLINLSIGNTTYPIDSHIVDQMTQSLRSQLSHHSYRGYGPETGLYALRSHIAKHIYQDRLSAEEITISDGAKCDLSRLFLLLGHGRSVAIQNPTYPAYQDAAILAGAREITYVPCNLENQFSPPVSAINRNSDLLILCSPNNPTGHVLSRDYLTELVQYACDHGILILFDAAYAAFIQDPRLPKSIFEITGAEYCAIEMQSLSKPLGFTGMRLGWTAMSKKLQYICGNNVLKDWQQVIATSFNGASLPIQDGGMVGISNLSVSPAIQYYRENSRLLMCALRRANMPYCGGEHAPYLWVKLPHGMNSSDGFDLFLHTYHIATTPGSGFGQEGEGYIRLSALGTREDILTACDRIKESACLSTLSSRV